MRVSKGQMLSRYAAIIDEDQDVIVEWVNNCVNEGWPGSPDTEKERLDHMKEWITKRIDESTTGRIMRKAA